MRKFDRHRRDLRKCFGSAYARRRGYMLLSYCSKMAICSFLVRTQERNTSQPLELYQQYDKHQFCLRNSAYYITFLPSSLYVGSIQQKIIPHLVFRQTSPLPDGIMLTDLPDTALQPPPWRRPAYSGPHAPGFSPPAPQAAVIRSDSSGAGHPLRPRRR